MVWEKNTKSCQKKMQLKTGLKEKHEKLSKEDTANNQIGSGTDSLSIYIVIKQILPVSIAQEG
jgi:hypothetical protein